MPRKNNQQRRKKAAEVAEEEANNSDVQANGDEENGANGNDVEELETKMSSVRVDDATTNRACSSVLTSHPESRDLHMLLSVNFYSEEILADAKLELNNGRRYGLIGRNGAGKSTLLQVLANREISYPSHFDSYLLQGEFEKCDKTVMQAVVDVDKTRLFLEQEAEELAVRDDDESQSRLMDVYARLDEIEADLAEAKAGRILRGLGFTAAMTQQKVSDFSGGWRMRVALARALFVRPSLLLLDEPTNHLDLESCVWLEEELKNYPRILVVISHSQDFLNTVCTNIIRLAKRSLTYYSGNYDTYVRTRAELEENQTKRHKWEQSQQQHLKDYIAKYGHGTAKLAAQAKSREKLLAKMVAAGQTEAVEADKSLEFSFPNCGELPPPVIMVQNVSFRYGPDKPFIYRNLDTGIDLQTRVALVGPNGAGKSTFLKLIVGELQPSDGCIRRHSHVRIGRYNQHLADQVDLDASALDWMMRQYPDVKEIDEMRQALGRYGLTGAQQTCAIRVLSDGMRCRVVFAWLAFRSPHVLLLDEPTNHLDIETIDSLGAAINAFDGGVLLVSHDFRLISQVAHEIWICDKGTVRKYEHDIYTYKQRIFKRVQKLNKETMLTKTNGNATSN